MYNSEGFVSVYYKGNFKDGYFEDENAIEIVLDESYNMCLLYTSYRAG